MAHSEVRPLEFFNHKRKWYCLGRISERTSKFKHTFGGNPTDYGLSLMGSALPLHLLFRVDLADQRVGIEIPNVRWLPLCYGFGFGGEHTVYRVHSDTQIESILPIDSEFDPDFPYDGYPLEFTRRPIQVSRWKYNPRVVDDALRLAGVFGLSRLSSTGRKLAIDRLEEFGFFEEGEAFDMTKDEFLETCEFPFMQGAPKNDCPNPDCSRFGVKDSTTVFAMIQGDPSPDVSLWGDYMDVQLIFQICRYCNCIRVTNQCT